MATSKGKDRRAHAALQDLGLTEIEARIYAHLLVHSPTTGYRVSLAIGTPMANTYKAITELARRGAVQIDDGQNRMVRATPVEELLAQLDRDARERRQAAKDALQHLAGSGADDRVYTLHTVEQVLERAQSMIRRAKKIVVADLSPRPFAELRAALEAAAGRRVTVAAKVYGSVADSIDQVDATGSTPSTPSTRSTTSKGSAPSTRARPAVRGRKRATIDLVVDGNPSAVEEAWPGQQLSLVTDAREHLLALLSADLDDVHQAVWSNSTFLSCMHHNHVAIEIEHTRLRAPATPTLLLSARPPGLIELQRRYGRRGDSVPETGSGGSA